MLWGLRRPCSPLESGKPVPVCLFLGFEGAAGVYGRIAKNVFLALPASVGEGEIGSALSKQTAGSLFGGAWLFGCRRGVGFLGGEIGCLGLVVGVGCLLVWWAVGVGLAWVGVFGSAAWLFGRLSRWTFGVLFVDSFDQKIEEMVPKKIKKRRQKRAQKKSLGFNRFWLNPTVL